MDALATAVAIYLALGPIFGLLLMALGLAKLYGRQPSPTILPQNQGSPPSAWVIMQ